MDASTFADQATLLATWAAKLSEAAEKLAQQSTELIVAQAPAMTGGYSSFLSLFTIFIMACFVGYYVVWSVTPALHSPLMGVTNAISSVIIVGGLLAAGPSNMDFSKIMGFLAVMLASVNIFGGFIVTQRMLAMFKKKKK
jgi:NAD(P) transhydrogenase subunit alpha